MWGLIRLKSYKKTGHAPKFLEVREFCADRPEILCAGRPGLVIDEYVSKRCTRAGVDPLARGASSEVAIYSEIGQASRDLSESDRI